MEPRECGDPRVKSLLLNGRDEEIEVTEPRLNYPIPENPRFVAEVDERPVVDVLFVFNAESERPYNLHFNVRDGLDYQKFAGDAKLEAFKQMKIYSRSTL